MLTRSRIQRLEEKYKQNSHDECSDKIWVVSVDPRGQISSGWVSCEEYYRWHPEDRSLDERAVSESYLAVGPFSLTNQFRYITQTAKCRNPECPWHGECFRFLNQFAESRPNFILGRKRIIHRPTAEI